MGELMMNAAPTIFVLLASLVLLYFWGNLAYNAGRRSGRRSSIIRLASHEAKLTVLESIIDEYAPSYDKKAGKWITPDGVELPEGKVSIMLKLHHAIEGE